MFLQPGPEAVFLLIHLQISLILVLFMIWGKFLYITVFLFSQSVSSSQLKSFKYSWLLFHKKLEIIFLHFLLKQIVLFHYFFSYILLTYLSQTYKILLFNVSVISDYFSRDKETTKLSFHTFLTGLAPTILKDSSWCLYYLL